MNRAWVVVKRGVALGLVASLLLLAATPVEAYSRGGFWFGFGAGALLTAPFWWPYPYRAYPYAYPSAYPYPYPYYPPYTGYVYPAPSAVSLPAALTPPSPALPPSEPTVPAPGPPAGAPSGALTCETVWVEGHYETYIDAAGQAVTVWVPAASREFCRQAS